MKRAVVAIFCCAVLSASAAGAAADSASDQDMANRYLQAARSGDDDAQFYLGALYSAGVGLPRSDEEAFSWFSRAADRGNSHAMLIVSGLYASGRGVQKDYVRAYEYAYVVSSTAKVDEFRNGSRQLMGVLETRMTPDEINRAKTDASQWHAVSSPNQVKASVPADNTRATPLSPPPPPASSNPRPPPPASNPQAAPATSNPLPSARASNEPAEPRNPAGKNVKKDDVDNILDQVPQGLRKRFGF
jgi:Sel1 repeat